MRRRNEPKGDRDRRHLDGLSEVRRTSTLEMQDPRASLRRQLRSSQARLPPGWFIAAVYWDVESGGGLDLEACRDGYDDTADGDLEDTGSMEHLFDSL
jgi:hypothetical protein